VSTGRNAERRNDGIPQDGGINIRRGAEAGEDYMYVAMSNTNRTMGDDEGDIQLNGDEWGAVYRMPLESDYDISEMEPIVTGGPEANICGGCPGANPNANDKACQSCAFNPTKDDEDQRSFKGHDESGKIDGHEWANLTDVENTIAEPDNIVVMDDGRVVIGEDTGNRGHENNMIWVFDPGSAGFSSAPILSNLHFSPDLGVMKRALPLAICASRLDCTYHGE